MRPWDNIFWWLEVNDLPEKSMVSPANWPPPREARPFRMSSSLLNGNKVLGQGPGRADYGVAWSGTGGF